jgi:glycosyltransferase involved in cell wall biosynthesis
MLEKQYPKISIVTPSFNQAHYIEKTITSVIDQKYPNIEYIIFDAGSTDGSVEIIRKYEDKITFWESKPDKGQADAIYRGFEMATGDIIAWVNSDDYYLPGSFNTVGEYFRQKPETRWLIGNGIVINAEGKELLRCFTPPVDFEKLIFYKVPFIQPSIFFSRKTFFECGGFDRNMTFSFDLDLFLNLAKGGTPAQIDFFLSAFRFHKLSKTSTLNSTRLRESAFIRDVKHGQFTKNRILFFLKKWKNILWIVLFRFRTSGVRQYTSFLLKK